VRSTRRRLAPMGSGPVEGFCILRSGIDCSHEPGSRVRFIGHTWSMDAVAAGLIGGIGGGLAGGLAAIGAAFLQRRWDMAASEAEREANEVSVRQASLTRAVARLWAAAVEAQMAAAAIDRLPVAGLGREHLAQTLGRLPILGSAVVEAYTEIHLICDEPEVVDVARSVLGAVERLVSVSAKVRPGELRPALANLNRHLVHLRAMTREGSGLPAITEPGSLMDPEPIGDGCVSLPSIFDDREKDRRFRRWITRTAVFILAIAYTERMLRRVTAGSR